MTSLPTRARGPTGASRSARTSAAEAQLERALARARGTRPSVERAQRAPSGRGIAAGAADSSMTPEAEQDRQRGERRRPARRRPRPSARWRAAPATAARISRSTAGCSASSLRGQLGVAAVHRQRVLRQVVGADREEVGLRREQVGESRAAAGVSIITPMRRQARQPSSAASSAAMAAHGAQLRRGSATIGSMIWTWPAGSTRRMARSWARSSSGHARLTRTPRTPSAGLSSRRQRQVGDRLVAADVERADDQRPAAERVGDRLVGGGCSSSSGGASRSRNRNSVRSRPQPSAPLLDRRRGLARPRPDWRTPRCARPVRACGTAPARRPRASARGARGAATSRVCAAAISAGFGATMQPTVRRRRE